MTVRSVTQAWVPRDCRGSRVGRLDGQVVLGLSAVVDRDDQAGIGAVGVPDFLIL